MNAHHRSGMKNWFRKVDPLNFAKTQDWYIKQIDQFMKSIYPSHKISKTYYGHNKSQIMRKIEKGYNVGEIELNKVAKGGNNASFGSTSLYNSYVIKLLSNFDDPYLKMMHNYYLESQKAKKKPKDNVYIRMRKDIKRRTTIFLDNKNIVGPSAGSMSKFNSTVSIDSLR
jgi:hypothetical protein